MQRIVSCVKAGEFSALLDDWFRWQVTVISCTNVTFEREPDSIVAFGTLSESTLLHNRLSLNYYDMIKHQ